MGCTLKCAVILQQIVKKAARNAKLTDWKEIHCHTLRHSFATHLIEQGSSVSEVQAMLGHKSPETSLGYVHASGKMILDINHKNHTKPYKLKINLRLK